LSPTEPCDHARKVGLTLPRRKTFALSVRQSSHALSLWSPLERVMTWS
jgi:hypothetical protein